VQLFKAMTSFCFSVGWAKAMKNDESDKLTKHFASIATPLAEARVPLNRVTASSRTIQKAFLPDFSVS
jgi:hypothetical protein